MGPHPHLTHDTVLQKSECDFLPNKTFLCFSNLAKTLRQRPVHPDDCASKHRQRRILLYVLGNEVRSLYTGKKKHPSLNTCYTIEKQSLLVKTQQFTPTNGPILMKMCSQSESKEQMVWKRLQESHIHHVEGWLWHWFFATDNVYSPRGSRRSWGGPVVLVKKLEAVKGRAVHWAGSRTEAEARQSHTLSASLNASSAEWSEKDSRKKKVRVKQYINCEKCNHMAFQ